MFCSNMYMVNYLETRSEWLKQHKSNMQTIRVLMHIYKKNWKNITNDVARTDIRNSY